MTGDPVVGTFEVMSEEQLVDVVRRLAESLTPGDLDHTLGAITATAVEVLPNVISASLTVRHADDRLETFAPTDEGLRALDAAQYELREGPCYDAASDTVHVIANDLETDARFPKYAAVALAAGVRSQAGLRLFENPKSQGALNLYSDRVGAFEDFETLGALFAQQSAMAIGYAQEVQSLKEALNTRTTIGQAVGIVMERYGLTDERAFAFLARVSQQRNVKVRLVAQEIIAATGTGGDEEA